MRDLPKAVEKLISFGVDVNARDVWGFTALHFALMNSFESVARVLFNAGARLDPNQEAPLKVVTFPELTVFLQTNQRNSAPDGEAESLLQKQIEAAKPLRSFFEHAETCLLYTSDAADE
eukprot:TRINITY_DN4972_c0_g1_i2.p1 TRINITY_DN4972_c0_g1~~TRINITY_DN4972_c0_g1_i2.p1  ORF type:complete len:119 (+),score=25.58 TRINITY_DN4972_c0_g1_i2:205-561(+)